MADTTFENILGLQTEREQLGPGCFFCGAVLSKCKQYPVRRFKHVFEQIHANSNPGHQTYKNVCQHMVSLQKTSEDALHVYNCTSCRHWINSRDKDCLTLFPVPYLQHYIRTLQTYDNQCLDRRTIFRLAKCLTNIYSGRTNFYLTLFEKDERVLLAKIASNNTSNIFKFLAEHFQAKHCESLFCFSRTISEFLRDHINDNQLQWSDNLMSDKFFDWNEETHADYDDNFDNFQSKSPASNISSSSVTYTSKSLSPKIMELISEP